MKPDNLEKNAYYIVINDNQLHFNQVYTGPFKTYHELERYSRYAVPPDVEWEVIFNLGD